jgi:hypothetical protein
MRYRAIAGIAVAAAGIIAAVAPTASAAPNPNGKNYPTAFEFQLNHDQTVIADRSNIPAALFAANIKVPAGVWTNFVDVNAGALYKDLERAAAMPNGCFRYTLSIAPAGNDWYAQTTVYPQCPW